MHVFRIQNYLTQLIEIHSLSVRIVLFHKEQCKSESTSRKSLFRIFIYIWISEFTFQAAVCLLELQTYIKNVSLERDYLKIIPARHRPVTFVPFTEMYQSICLYQCQTKRADLKTSEIWFHWGKGNGYDRFAAFIAGAIFLWLSLYRVEKWNREVDIRL